MADKEWVRWVKAADAESFNQARAESDDQPSLEGATFAEMHISGFDFTGVDLSNTEWTNCMIEKVRFAQANLEGAYFDHSVLTDCEIAGGNFDGASFDAAIFLRTKFTEIDLSNTELEGCEFTDCQISDAVLEDIDWRDLSLTRINLTRIEGRSGQLVDVTLREAVFEDVDTSGLACARCRASVTGDAALPAGFEPLTGRRQRI